MNRSLNTAAPLLTFVVIMAITIAKGTMLVVLGVLLFGLSIINAAILYQRIKGREPRAKRQAYMLAFFIVLTIGLALYQFFEYT